MKNQITISEMVKAINEKYAAIPEKQVSAGIYVKTVGTKYVTLLNTWGKAKLEKAEIGEFYANHI